MQDKIVNEHYDRKPPIQDEGFYSVSVHVPEDASVFLHYIRTRLNKNKNFIYAMVGETGGGKSWATLSIMEALSIMMNRPFSIKENFAWTPYEFMQVHNKNKGRGTCICLDEGGTAINAKRFMSNVNIAIGNLYQTSRLYNYVYGLNLPDIGFLDKTVRKLLHCIIEVKHIDFERERTLIIPKLLMYDRGNADNKGDSKIYKKYLRVKRPFEPVRPLKAIWVHKPSDVLIKEYELLKREFTDKLNKNVENVVRDPNMDLVEEGGRLDLNEVESRVLYCRNMEGLNISNTSKALGLEESEIRKVLRQVRSKNWEVGRASPKRLSPIDIVLVKKKLTDVTPEFFN